MERGYHHLFVSDTSITELIHELGLGHKLAWLESKVGLYHDGKIWDFSTPLDLLKFKPLSLWQRVRVGLVDSAFAADSGLFSIRRRDCQGLVVAAYGPQGL